MSARSPRPWTSLLLLGPTGSGKTPLGEELADRGLSGRRCVHFDFGANLRSLAADAGAAEWLMKAELRVIRASLATGALFEDRDMPMIVRIVEHFAVQTGLGPGALLVLNGLPRHRGQAAGLSGIVTVERVVSLEADAAVIRERMRLDPGGDRAARTDDEIEAVRKRLSDYRERTLPLLEFYRASGVPICVIPVTGKMSAAEMYAALDRDIGRGEGEP